VASNAARFAAKQIETRFFDFAQRPLIPRGVTVERRVAGADRANKCRQCGGDLGDSEPGAAFDFGFRTAELFRI
jgi:hypothetical protein